MAETEPATVKTETVKASVWVPDPVLTLVLAALCIGVMSGVVAEKRGYLDGLERKKPESVITDNAEIDRRLIDIIKSKTDAQWERFLRQDAELRRYIDQNTCHCRWRGTGAVGEHPIGEPSPVSAAPPPPKK